MAGGACKSCGKPCRKSAKRCKPCAAQWLRSTPPAACPSCALPLAEAYGQAPFAKDGTAPGPRTRYLTCNGCAYFWSEDHAKDRLV